MARELLLEIGTEELPAGYVPPAIENLKGSAESALREAGIKFRQIETFGTPRRLILRVRELAEGQEDVVQEHQGPARAIAFDDQGRPTKAAVGFAKGRGVPVEELTVKKTPRGEYLFARVITPGRPTAEILPELLPDLIRRLVFPKSMRWGQGGLRFARPIRWLLALLDAQVIVCHLDGLSSGDITYGHRQLSPGPFRVSSAQAYWDVLAETGLMVDHRARREAIWDGLKQAAAAEGGRPVPDDQLLDIVTHLVELPKALCGRFDGRYLELPRDVLTTAMSEHQKYFAVVDEKNRLLPLFLVVSNGDPGCGDVILAGHQKVLAARLEDAKFFFQEDRRNPLAEKIDMLKQVVFQEDLGTLFEKTERIAALVEHLCEVVGLSQEDRRAARRAALLCKADLVTHMVGEKEFSKLQGYMGQQYALASGEPKAVAQAIFEHYLPRFAEDRLPESLPGALVAIADKVDTIAGCFAVGLIPSGSQDPYALRRAALGVIRILLQRELRLDVHQLADRALDLLAKRLKQERGAVCQGIRSFFRQRMEGQLIEMGLDPDVVAAVLSADDRDVVAALGRGRALQSFRAQGEFEALVQSARRVANILRDQTVSGEPSPAAFKAEAEKTLWQAVTAAQKKVMEAIQSRDYDRALDVIRDLVKPIDLFFDQILVMDPDPEMRDNRLRLLAQVGKVFMAMVDGSKIVIAGETSSSKKS